MNIRLSDSLIRIRLDPSDLLALQSYRTLELFMNLPGCTFSAMLQAAKGFADDTLDVERTPEGLIFRIGKNALQSLASDPDHRAERQLIDPRIGLKPTRLLVEMDRRSLRQG
jgi:hypothetical protein